MDRGDDDGPKLKPTLGLRDTAAINIGAIIGAGIFVVTGIVAGLASGIAFHIVQRYVAKLV